MTDDTTKEDMEYGYWIHEHLYNPDGSLKVPHMPWKKVPPRPWKIDIKPRNKEKQGR